MTCSKCGRKIGVGEKVIVLDFTEFKDYEFCSEKCAKSKLVEDIDVLFADNYGEYIREDPDPYAEHGVMRSDF